jgi:hypothetical protein
MRILITESQYKILLESNTESMQNVIDMAFETLEEKCEEGDFDATYVEHEVYATEEIKVVDVQKTTAKNHLTGKESSTLFVTIDIRYHSVFESVDYDEMIHELRLECENVVGKGNIRLKVRDSININTNREW